MTAPLPPLPMAHAKPAPSQEEKALRRAARDFEAVFMGLVIKSMRDTVEKNEMFHGGNAEDTFQGLLDSEYAEKLAGGGAFGIADAIVRDLGDAVRGRAAAKAYARGGQP